jgi:hypothetical protein
VLARSKDDILRWPTPGGFERIQHFSLTGMFSAGSSCRRARAAARHRPLIVNGVGSMSFGKTFPVNRLETALFSDTTTAVRSCGTLTLRRMGHEADEDVHLARTSA